MSFGKIVFFLLIIQAVLGNVPDDEADSRSHSLSSGSDPLPSISESSSESSESSPYYLSSECNSSSSSDSESSASWSDSESSASSSESESSASSSDSESSSESESSASSSDSESSASSSDSESSASWSDSESSASWSDSESSASSDSASTFNDMEIYLLMCCLDSGPADAVMFPERKYWVHPFLKDRLLKGEYYNLCLDLPKYPDKFYEYYRMSEETYNYILEKISPRLTKHSNFRECISPGEKLSLMLKFLVSGCNLKSLELTFRIHHSTISGILRDVFQAIWEEFSGIHMPVPDRERLRTIAREFEEIWQFPHVIGAIDGKHFRIVAPDETGSTYFNYKGFFSMVLQAVADARYRFIFVEAGGYGRTSDGGTFRASELYRCIRDRSLEIPYPEPLRYSVEDSNLVFPFFL